MHCKKSIEKSIQEKITSQGITIKEFSEKHGLILNVTYKVVSGKARGRSGEAFKVIKALLS